MKNTISKQADLHKGSYRVIIDSVVFVNPDLGEMLEKYNELDDELSVDIKKVYTLVSDEIMLDILLHIIGISVAMISDGKYRYKGLKYSPRLDDIEKKKITEIVNPFTPFEYLYVYADKSRYAIELNRLIFDNINKTRRF